MPWQHDLYMTFIGLSKVCRLIPYIFSNIGAHAPLSEYRRMRQYAVANANLIFFSKRGFSATGACAKKRDNNVGET